MSADRIVSGIDDLIAYFHAAETPVEEWRIGTEHEKIGIRRVRPSSCPDRPPCRVSDQMSAVLGMTATNIRVTVTRDAPRSGLVSI